MQYLKNLYSSEENNYDSYVVLKMSGVHWSLLHCEEGKLR